MGFPPTGIDSPDNQTACRRKPWLVNAMEATTIGKLVNCVVWRVRTLGTPEKRLFCS